MSLALAAAFAWMAATAAEPPVTALAFAPDGRTLVVGSQMGLRLCAWPDLGASAALDTRLSHIHDLSFSPDGGRLAVAGGAPAEEGAVELFDWPARRLVRRIGSHDDVIYGLAWRGDGKAFAAASLDGKAGLYDAANGNLVRMFTGHSRGATAAAFLTDDALVTASLDQTLRLWDASTGNVVRTLDNHTRAVHALALRPAAPEGALPMVASISDDRTVRLWQPTIGRLVRFVRLEQASPLAICWTIDGGEMLVACADGQVRRIDPEAAQVAQALPVVNGRAHAIAMHPSGKEIAVGGGEGKVARVSLSHGMLNDDGPRSRSAPRDGSPPPAKPR